ncbi:hypothetical protein ASF87_10275 [Microbacterium sp. Leaf161]|uniref:hypothetical protein n=1 Tax=Microbacterium sp. Leaf161 TaxID=1736281 RepID=UPI000701AC37|nr:hypothetical protein [Microbacterium sp. Leaf161]KQR49169.1 hypothetical protein ASF87_10275 [Microbacterium sp. Leaf161]
MPAVAPSNLDWIPPSITVTDLKPGDSITTTFSLHNTNPVPIELRAVEFRDGDLFAGPTPLTVDITLSMDDTCPLNQDAIPPGATVNLTMTAALPAEAGNEYQGLEGTATVAATATEASVCETSSAGLGHGLASTGGAADPTITVLVAGTLIAAGVMLARRARKRGRQAQ